MGLLHNINATRLSPWLCATTAPLFTFSCVALDAGRGVVRHPRSSTRARRGTFWCKPVWARMQRLAIGGGVIIGTAAYSNSAPQCASRALTEGNEGTP